MTSLLVVEDHPLFVQSLVRLLREKGNYEVASVASGEQALQQLGDAAGYDLILIDVSLPGQNGIDLIAEIHRRNPAMPCLMVSGHTASHYVHQSMEAGARGYVLKEDISGILEGIRQVLRGGTYLSRAVRPRE